MDALTFLGTGCGIPMTDRFHSSILLEDGGRRWLLDAGEPCSQRLKAMGVPFDSLDAMFISHGHSDHISGLPMIIQGAWLEGRAPAAADLSARRIDRAGADVAGGGLPAGKADRVSHRIPRAGRPLAGATVALDGGRLRVSVNPTSHLDGLRTMIDAAAADRFRAYSMVFDWRDGKRLIYSADLGRPEDMAALLARPCDLLVCEMAHFAPEELFALLAGQAGAAAGADALDGGVRRAPRRKRSARWAARCCRA